MRSVKAIGLILSLLGLPLADDVMAQATQATIGAEAAAFTARFGKPLQDVGPAKFYTPCAGSESGAKWGITLKGSKVTSIERSACGPERLDSATVKKEAVAMMPSDAAPVREFRSADGRQVQEYRSSSLSKSFAADDFVTCDAEGRIQKVQQGTLSFATAADGRSWHLILGTCF